MVAEPSEKKKNIPEFRPGDTVRVHIKVIEGDSERVQVFEGTVILRSGSGDSQTFTVRKISFGVGVERTFPLCSPHIDKIEIMKAGRVRRARLYYLRQLSGKAARVNEVESRQDAPGENPAPSAGASNESNQKADGKAETKASPAHAPALRKHSEPGDKRALGAAPAQK